MQRMWGIDMGKVYLNESTLSDIADAIRDKTGGSGLITPANMPTEIASISGGGVPTLNRDFLNITTSVDASYPIKDYYDGDLDKIYTFEIGEYSGTSQYTHYSYKKGINDILRNVKVRVVKSGAYEVITTDILLCDTFFAGNYTEGKSNITFSTLNYGICYNSASDRGFSLVSFYSSSASAQYNWRYQDLKPAIILLEQEV